MAVVYVGMVGAWLGEMVRLHEHVLPVHFLCLLCIVVKMLEFILVAVYYHRQVREHDHVVRTPKRPLIINQRTHLEQQRPPTTTTSSNQRPQQGRQRPQPTATTAAAVRLMTTAVATTTTTTIASLVATHLTRYKLRVAAAARKIGLTRADRLPWHNARRSGLVPARP